MVKEKIKLNKFTNYLLIGLIVCFIGISNVSAELLYNYDFQIINRNYDDLPFDTWYDDGEVATYNDNSVIISSEFNDDLSNLPRYMYLIYCATGPLNFATTNVDVGNISNNGSIVGGYCEVNNNTGNYYLNRWTVKDWQNIGAVNSYVEYAVIWDIDVYNQNGFYIDVNVQSFFLSNELIQNFSSDYLLSQILQQNSSLKSELNNVKSNTNETNNKLDTTNKELEDVNDNIGQTNDKLDGIQGALTDSSTPNISDLENSIGWLPPGPIDSILNLPLTMLNSLTNSLTKTCSPLSIKLPFVNKDIQIPCLSAIFAQITGVNGLWTWVGTIASVLILYNYLLNLYAWVDKVLTLRAEFDEAMGADLANWGRL